jgi:hypothetical protein
MTLNVSDQIVIGEGNLLIYDIETYEFHLLLDNCPHYLEVDLLIGDGDTVFERFRHEERNAPERYEVHVSLSRNWFDNAYLSPEDLFVRFSIFYFTTYSGSNSTIGLNCPAIGTYTFPFTDFYRMLRFSDEGHLEEVNEDPLGYGSRKTWKAKKFLTGEQRLKKLFQNFDEGEYCYCGKIREDCTDNCIELMEKYYLEYNR